VVVKNVWWRTELRARMMCFVCGLHSISIEYIVATIFVSLEVQAVSDAYHHDELGAEKVLEFN
jgi:hypothetical protein